MTEKRRRLLSGAAAAGLVLLTLLINIKNIFTSCQIDAEYQVTMAYRLLRGDEMFSQMWEAHQTSAFFLAFFEWIFLKLTGSTTGILVYANAVGAACKTAVAFALYGTFRKYTDKRLAFAALIFALNAYPKDIVLPDFANLQIWFALLLMCCLIRYFQDADRILWLILGAVFLCLEVLAYPSCALVWIACMVLIGMYSPRKKRDWCVFTGICAVSGAAWLLYFMRGNPQQFLQYVYYIWAGDESHAVGPDGRLAQLGQDFVLLAADLKYIAVEILCAAALTFACRAVCVRRGGQMPGRKLFRIALSWFMGFYVLGYLIGLRAEDAGTKFHFFTLYLFVEGAAFLLMKYLDSAEKKIFLTGQLVGLGGFIATLVLSDMGWFSAVPYLIPNLCVSILPLGKALGEERGMASRVGGFLPVLLLCGVMLFRNLVYLNGWMVAPTGFYEDSIFGVNWTAQYGPLKGVVNREGTYVADVSYLEWQNMMEPGDKLLVLSYPTLTPTVYLYSDVEICVDSTISTPTYSGRLFEYWRENPDKYPNVVAVKCYEGNLMIGEYNEVVEWLVEEFEADEIVDGTFWRYYIRRQDGGRTAGDGA